MIAVECYADTRLVLTLGITKASVNHEYGKSRVLDALRTGRAKVGLVDEDPGAAEVPEMRNYRLAENLDGIRLLRHIGGPDRRVIVICPRLEEWMLGRAQKAGIDPSTFGLANDPRKLHASGRYDRHLKFPSFIKQLLAVDPEFQKLKEWLR